MKIIFADFNSFDGDGFIRLSCVGTTQDLEEAGLVLAEGMRLCVSDGDLEADIIVRAAPAHEGGGWRGEIVGEVRDC